MNIWRTILLIGLGGGIGSIGRYLTALYVHKHYAGIFPLATLIINLLGSLLIGILFGCMERYQWSSPDLKFLFIIGFCGGYTTFSAFAIENVNLMQSNHTATAFAYIGLSLILGLAATWVGLSLVKMI
ncbi:MAG: crcB [Chitinophagaceae bacterium]|nr:crcB [Chitinophagaceae bacterium]